MSGYPFQGPKKLDPDRDLIPRADHEAELAAEKANLAAHMAELAKASAEMDAALRKHIAVLGEMLMAQGKVRALLTVPRLLDEPDR
jgi:hypothetical protein